MIQQESERFPISGSRAETSGNVGTARYPALLLLPILLGIGLRVVTLGMRPVWDDEAWTYFASASGWQHLLATLRVDSHPALFYLAEMLPLQLFGRAEWALRLVSVVSGLGLIGLAASVQARLSGRQAGFLAAALLAVSPLLVYSSQEARSYSLLAVETLAGAWLFWSHARQPSWSRGLLAFGVVVLASWTHYYGTFLLAFGACAALLNARRNFWPAIAPVVAGFVGALALLPLIVAQKQSYAGYSFSGGGYGEDLGLVRSLARSFLAMGNAGYPEGLLRPVGHLLFAVIALILVAAVLRDPRARAQSLFPGLLAAVLLVCWQVGGRLNLWPIRDNYLAVIAPAALLVLVNGIQALKRGALRSVVLVALLAVMLTGDLALTWGPGGHPNPDFRTAADLIRQRNPEGVLLGRSWGDLSCYRFYERAETPVAVYGVDPAKPTMEARVVGASLSSFEELVPSRNRLCLLAKDSGATGIQAYSSQLTAAGYTSKETIRLEGVHLSFWERTSTK